MVAATEVSDSSAGKADADTLKMNATNNDQP
jgi:hypothetical protein